MAADLETGLKWARDDYVRDEMERQRRALKEIAARRRGRDEGGVVILDDSDEVDGVGAREGVGGGQRRGGREEVPGPSNHVRHGNLG